MARQKKINVAYALSILSNALKAEFGLVDNTNILLRRIDFEELKRLFKKIRLNEPIVIGNMKMDLISWRYAGKEQWLVSDRIKPEDFSRFEVYKIKNYILLKKQGCYLQLFSENEDMID